MQKLYAAPLEGVTGFVWRTAHRQVFGGADRYFTPFITPNGSMTFQEKELRELRGGEKDLIPQLLTNRADYFCETAKRIRDMGFEEINFNLGCPSGTVVAKRKGSGLLRDPAELRRLLTEIFDNVGDIRVSVKTRTGIRSQDEWPALLEIFEDFPLSELIIHPRTQSQFYSGLADRDVFLKTMESSPLPLVYNGDVEKLSDPAFGWGCPLMAGRGLIRDPSLFRERKGGAPASREEIVLFHELMIEGYRKYIQGEIPLTHRMKELWSYLSCSFVLNDNDLKDLRKTKTFAQFKSCTDNILQNRALREVEK